MIIKGKSRAGAASLAAHLGNAEKNERVTLLESRGTVANDLRGALVEMEAYGSATRCVKALYHAAISPEPPHRLTPEQRAEAIDALEEKLGLTGHSRVVVMHEKLGREHVHVVWSRINLDRLISVSDGHNYRRHEEVSRDLERRFGHERVQGAHAEREGPDGERVDRPDRTPSRAELRQEERTGIKGKDVKADVTAAFRASDNPEAFKAALEAAGYFLAKGDRRDFVVVDRAGGIHSLARRIDGIRAAELRGFMGPIDRERIPGIEDVRERNAESARLRRAGLAERAYSRGEDYVTQTRAALRDHRQRMRKLNADANKDSMWDRIESGKRGRDEDEERRRREEEKRRKQEPKGARETDRVRNVEMTDEQRARMARLLNAEKRERQTDDDHDDDPDRQPKAPGGGRTRGR